MTISGCGNLSDPANGSITLTAGTTLGQTATYSCNTGYTLVGDRTRTCQATGEWSGSAPTCQGVYVSFNDAVWCRLTSPACYQLVLFFFFEVLCYQNVGIRRRRFQCKGTMHMAAA